MEGEHVNVNKVNQQAQQPSAKQEASPKSFEGSDDARANKVEESKPPPTPPGTITVAPDAGGKHRHSSTNDNRDPNTTDANGTIVDIEGGTDDVQTYHSLMSLMKREPYHHASNTASSPTKQPPSQKTDGPSLGDNASYATDYASVSSKEDNKENLPKMSDVLQDMDSKASFKMGRFDSMSSTNAVCSAKHRQSKRRCVLVTSICVGVAALCGSLIYFVAQGISQGKAEGWVSSNILGPMTGAGESHYLRQKLPLSKIKESNDRMAARATSVFQFLADESWVSSMLGGDGGHHNLRKATLPSSETVARVAAKAPRVHSKEAKHQDDQLSSSSADLAPNLRIARTLKRIMSRLLHQEDVGSDDEKEKRRQTMMAMAADSQGQDYSFMYAPQENQGPPHYYAEQYVPQENQDYGGMMAPGARHLQMMPPQQQQGFQHQFQNQGQQQQFQHAQQQQFQHAQQQQFQHAPQENQGPSHYYAEQYAPNNQDYGEMMAPGAHHLQMMPPPPGGAQQLVFPNQQQQQGFEQQQGFQQQFQNQGQQQQFQQGQVGGFMDQQQQFQQQQGGQVGYN